MHRALPALLAVACAVNPSLRKFPDRPVAWQEHDDASIRGTPHVTVWEKTRASHAVLEEGRRLDRVLAMRTRGPADDVNALDEVPCSTWFCPRNHLHPLTAEEITRGPGLVPGPEPPFVIEKSKGAGAALGLIVRDARGRKWILKFDPVGHLGLQTGAEALGARLYWAAGYHVPDAYVIDLDDRDLRIEHGATWYFMKFQQRPLTRAWLEHRFGAFARGPDGRLRAVAIAFLPGKLLGGFDHQGTRTDDPNDRIPHEKRRSVRATWMLAAWLNRFDTGPANSLDALVEQDGRRFVRHYVVDFGSMLGAASVTLQSPHDGAESYYSPTRTVLAFLSLGGWQRNWQKYHDAWEDEVRRHPSFGFYPTDGWDPRRFRSGYVYAAYDQRTAVDDYFGAKLVTSFTDEQLRAAVRAGRYPEDEAEALVAKLALRRDAIARRYLTSVTAVETPTVNPAGTMLCFRDLALERGAVAPGRLSYVVRVEDDAGNPLVALRAHPRGAGGCLPIGAGGSRPYRVVTITAETPGHQARPARVHVSLRAAERRWVVVGMERP